MDLGVVSARFINASVLAQEFSELISQIGLTRNKPGDMLSII